MTDAALWLWVEDVAVGAALVVDDECVVAELVELDVEPPHPANPVDSKPARSAATASLRCFLRRCLRAKSSMGGFYVRHDDVRRYPPDVTE